MIELFAGIFEFIFDMVGLVLGLVFDAIGLVFGLLGGLLSLVCSLGGIILVVVLVRWIVKRRREAKKDPDVLVDENGEEFVSYYAQEK